MKNFIKIAGIIAMVAVIGLSFIGCSGSGKSDSGNSDGSGETSAQTVNGGEPYVIPASDFVYELSADGTGVRVLDYTGPGGNIIFPTEIEGLPIVEFPDTRGAMEVNNVTSVVFPDYYLRFFESDNSSFVEAKQTEMVINSLGAINRGGIFILTVGSPITINRVAEDDPLVNVTFPKGISYIPADIFGSARSVKSYTIPDTVKFISEAAFRHSGLTSIVIPEGVTTIASEAFSGCVDLKSVTLPESIIAIGNEAFLLCTNLETVNLPSHKIQYMDGRTFIGCTKLSLATQKALRDSGYEGTFRDDAF